MKILIACEESQTVCKAFRLRGHEAYSNDLIECSGGHPEWHLQMDCFEAIESQEWDFIGMHPPCTSMTLSGNRHYAPGKPKHQMRLDSVEWTIGLWHCAIRNAKHVYLENPMGAMNGDKRLPKPQIVQPYFFGDEFQKTTCLWLMNLPLLFHNAEVNLFDSEVTHVGKGEFIEHKSGKKKSKWYADSFCLPKEERAKVRSVTFPGIANAMAEQWGGLLIK